VRGGAKATIAAAHDATSDPVPFTLVEAAPLAADEPVPYALTERASDLFVVDTTDVADLRRRCPELFVRRPDDAA